jgi:hypothetical protein
VSRRAVIRRLCMVAVCAVPGWVSAAAIGQLGIAATVDTHQVHIADPVRLHLRVEGLEVSQRAHFPQDLSAQLPEHVVARRLGPIAAADSAASYDLRLFEVGDVTIEALDVSIIDGGDTLTLQTAPIDLRVVPLREEGETDLRQIKPPWAIGGGIPIWLVVLFVVLLIAALAWVASRYLLNRAPPAVRLQPSAPTDFSREFSRIESMGLLERGALKLYYTHLADVLRRLLEEQLQIEASERTTQEIATDVARHSLASEAIHRQILEFLSAADLVKFARAEPPIQEARAMPARGRQIVMDLAAQQAARVAVQQDNETTKSASSVQESEHVA